MAIVVNLDTIIADRNLDPDSREDTSDENFACDVRIDDDEFCPFKAIVRYSEAGYDDGHYFCPRHDPAPARFRDA